MSDILVGPELIFEITLWVNSTMAYIYAMFSYKLTSFSTEWTQKHNFGVCIAFSDMPDTVVCLESTLDFILKVVQDGRHL